MKKRTRHHERNRQFIAELKLSNPCSMCGETDPRCLDFDHHDPAVKVASIGYLVQQEYGLQTILKEIGKCQILCANCHRIKTAKQFNHFSHKHLTYKING
jgi:hypothetical protein